MNIPNLPKKLQKQAKMIEAQGFLYDHPAFCLNQDQFEPIITCHIQCKRGYFYYDTNGKEYTVTVYSHEEDYEKWRASEYFDPTLDITLNGEVVFKANVEVPYAARFGEEWTPHSVGWYVELYFGIWKEISDYRYTCLGSDRQKVESYEAFIMDDIDMGFESYEDCWIGIAEYVKKNFGDFSQDDFYTEAEVEHNKNRSVFTDKCLERNPEYINLSDAELNHRWLTEWFIHSDFLKQNDYRSDLAPSDILSDESITKIHLALQNAKERRGIC